MDHVTLRTSVAEFALDTKCDSIAKLKESYEQVIENASDKTWSQYWEDIRKPGEWVDYIFIQVILEFKESIQIELLC